MPDVYNGISSFGNIAVGVCRFGLALDLDFFFFFFFVCFNVSN